jgi:hypothetical protein
MCCFARPTELLDMLMLAVGANLDHGLEAPFLWGTGVLGKLLDLSPEKLVLKLAL